MPKKKKTEAPEYDSFTDSAQREFLGNEVHRVEGEKYTISLNIKRQSRHLWLCDHPTPEMKKQDASVLTALKKQLTTERNGNQVSLALVEASLSVTKAELAALPPVPEDSPEEDE